MTRSRTNTKPRSARLPLAALACCLALLTGSLPARAQLCSGTTGPALPARSFADEVVSYSPAILSGQPTVNFQNAQTALGPDDWAGDNNCYSSCTFASLGQGGSLVLRFTDNVLTGDGTAACDLWIFEVGGNTEWTFVDISADGTNWHSVGETTGQTKGIDIDAFGYGPADQFRYVRITDDPNQGSNTGLSDGADIDAVGAIASLPSCTISSASPSDNLAPGDVVSITGTGFGAGAAVTFGGVSATQTTVVSATQLQATVPAIVKGSYTVTVTVPGDVPCSLGPQVVGVERVSWGSVKAMYR